MPEAAREEVEPQAAEPEIICERRGAAGVVILNRPRALNALSLGMVRGLAAALDAWEDDPRVARIVVLGAGGKAFCAGGDIRAMHDLGRAGRFDEMLTFWREEYILNARIQRYPKPYVALIDGIVMGGGVGISLHGSHRVAGERYLFAMPEVGIGFFPDVGATYALPRVAGGAGIHLALTGDRIGQVDAHSLGLATAAVPSEAFPELTESLTETGSTDEIIARFARDPGPGCLEREHAALAACRDGGDLRGVLAALEQAAAAGDAFAARTLQTMQTKSPTSLAIALRQMREGGGLDFAGAMRLEFRIVSRIVRGHDFYEGVRAVLVDKDHAPRWNPATLAELDPAVTEAYFAPFSAGESELEL